jgi:hypothetical protein
LGSKASVTLNQFRFVIKDRYDEIHETEDFLLKRRDLGLALGLFEKVVNDLCEGVSGLRE